MVQLKPSVSLPRRLTVSGSWSGRMSNKS